MTEILILAPATATSAGRGGSVHDEFARAFRAVTEAAGRPTTFCRIDDTGCGHDAPFGFRQADGEIVWSPPTCDPVRWVSQDYDSLATQAEDLLSRTAPELVLLFGALDAGADLPAIIAGLGAPQVAVIDEYDIRLWREPPPSASEEAALAPGKRLLRRLLILDLVRFADMFATRGPGVAEAALDFGLPEDKIVALAGPDGASADAVVKDSAAPERSLESEARRLLAICDNLRRALHKERW